MNNINILYTFLSFLISSRSFSLFSHFTARSSIIQSGKDLFMQQNQWQNMEKSISSEYKQNIKNAAILSSSILFYQFQSQVTKAEEKLAEPLIIPDKDFLKTPDDLDMSTSNLKSDEFIVSFSNQSIGLRLQEVAYKGFSVVTVRQILDKRLAEEHPELEVGVIVTKIGVQAVDGLPLKQVANFIKNNERPVLIQFRDPNRFLKQLDSTAGPPRRFVSTSYLPKNTKFQGYPEQVITVERLSMPPPQERKRAAQMLDVMQIQYVAQVLGEERIADSSAERSAPGTTKSIYYILGQQNGPPGKFPPGWDLTLTGMVPGEKRRITLPSSLAYDLKGDKYRKIPPYATMVYTVKLLSLT